MWLESTIARPVDQSGGVEAAAELAVQALQTPAAGTIRHGTSVSNTNTIGVNATRSSMRGRPICSTSPRRHHAW
jgi:hypothetical protein